MRRHNYFSPFPILPRWLFCKYLAFLGRFWNRLLLFFRRIGADLTRCIFFYWKNLKRKRIEKLKRKMHVFFCRWREMIAPSFSTTISSSRRRMWVFFFSQCFVFSFQWVEFFRLVMVELMCVAGCCIWKEDHRAESLWVSFLWASERQWQWGKGFAKEKRWEDNAMGCWTRRLTVHSPRSFCEGGTRSWF